MFESLTVAEKRELSARLHQAGREFAQEANELAGAPAPVLASYDLPRDGFHAFYEASIEACALSVQVWAEHVPSGLGWPS